MPAFDIRPALPADAAELARLSGQLGYPVDAGEMSRRLALVLADPARAVLVADAGGNLLGWLGVEQRTTLEGGTQAEIVGFVVDARVRRSGVGQRLLQAAEAWTRERGFAELRVRSNIARAESHPFYEKHGFVRRKTQHVYSKRLQIRE